jgi:hypothetical protein
MQAATGLGHASVHLEFGGRLRNGDQNTRHVRVSTPPAAGQTYLCVLPVAPGRKIPVLARDFELDRWSQPPGATSVMLTS